MFISAIKARILNFAIKSVLISLVLGTFFFQSCKQADSPITYAWGYSASTITGLITTVAGGAVIPKPTFTDYSQVPTAPDSCLFVPIRYGSNNYAATTTSTGTVMSNVHSGFLQLLTLNNPPLSAVGVNTSVTGWLTKGVVSVYANGSTDDVTNLLNDSLCMALSVIMTYYPDGFFSIYNLNTPKHSDWGWYQVVLNDDSLPIAIIYKVLGSGALYADPVRIPGPVLAYGIWGLSVNYYYPLIQLDGDTFIFLKMAPIVY